MKSKKVSDKFYIHIRKPYFLMLSYTLDNYIMITENYFHADNVVWLATVTVKHHVGPHLTPNKLTMFVQQSVVSTNPLSFMQHCTNTMQYIIKRSHLYNFYSVVVRPLKLWWKILNIRNFDIATKDWWELDIHMYICMQHKNTGEIKV